MDLLQLEQFRVIAQYENMTKAAEKLFVSQPALSQMLTKLENDLGYALFIRNKGKIKLNENGRLVLEYCDKIFSQIDEMQSSLENLNNKDKLIRFGFDSGEFGRIVSTVFVQKNPSMPTSISINHSDEILKQLLNKELDVVFISKNIEDGRIESLLFYKEYFWISIPNSHPLSLKENIYLKDLNNQYFIRSTSESGFSLYQEFNKLIKKSNIKINVVHEAEPSLLPLFYDKEYLFFLGSSNLKKLKYQHRTVKKISDNQAMRSIYMCYLKANKKRIHETINWLEENYREVYKQL